MVEANMWYVVEVNSKFRFVYHFIVIFTRDDRFFILCQEKHGAYITFHGISLTFIYCRSFTDEWHKSI